MQDVGSTIPELPTGEGDMRILVVDNQADAADTRAELLRKQGHPVDVAYSPGEALQRSLDCAPDVAFLDLVMPGMDGW